MSLSYRLIKPVDLDSYLVDVWYKILADNQIYQSPYFCPEFTQLVSSVRDDVKIVVIERSGCPVGFFPYQRSFLGVGKPVGGPLSDFHGVIADTNITWEVHQLMRAAHIKVWDFNHLVGNPAQFKQHVISQDISPQIDLSQGYAQYEKEHRASGSKYIQKTKTLARKLEKEVGRISFTFHESDGSALKQLIHWKSNQYKRTNLFDIFGVNWTGELLQRLLQIQTPNFGGVCSVLRAGDHIVAVHMGMRSQKTLHYWFPAYDVKFAMFSPGIILLLRLANELDNKEIEVIDLGKGMSQYKERLMNRSVLLQEGSVELPSIFEIVRKIRQRAHDIADRGEVRLLHLPLRAINRILQTRKFR